MGQPYTYLLTFKPTGQKYYGVRIANKKIPKEDLWNTYYSSSRVVSKLREEHGDDSFEAIVDKVFETEDEARKYESSFIKDLNLPTDKWLNKRSVPLNIKRGKDSYWYGKHLPADVRKKISESRKGKYTGKDNHNYKNPAAANALVALAKGPNNPNIGRHHTEETKKKISESNIGKKWTDEMRQRVSGTNSHSYGKRGKKSYWFGKTHSEDTKEKIRQARKNQTISEETKKKISISLKKSNHPLHGLTGSDHPAYGKKMSEEVKQNTRDRWAKIKNEICPHCGKEGRGGSMNRWHFDNCRNKR